MSAWLVVGLGNPGPRYAGNRHNVGRMVLDALVRRESASLRQHRTSAHVAETRVGLGPGGLPGARAVLAAPSSYMNLAGPPVAALCSYYNVGPQQLLVIHDDLDLAPGTIRLKKDGGEGGHNGLRSISQALNTTDYVRLRIGIGRPPGRQAAADYVLTDFPPAERGELFITLEEAADAVTAVLNDGLGPAQQRLHTAIEADKDS